MLRLSQSGGLAGISDSDRDKLLLRVGASEYEALFPEIQKYSLEEQMNRFLRIKEEKDLKERRKILEKKIIISKNPFNQPTNLG